MRGRGKTESGDGLYIHILDHSRMGCLPFDHIEARHPGISAPGGSGVDYKLVLALNFWPAGTPSITQQH